MNFQYNCPECKKKLIQVEGKQQCSNCLQSYHHDDNYTIFKNSKLSYISDDDEYIKKLLIEIKHLGFEHGSRKYLITNNELSSQLVNSQFDQSADIIFHGIGKKFFRCLNIKDEFGSKSEILSNIFKQVYLIEFDDNSIELQKKRFKEKKCSNITIAKCDLLKLPFPDNFFDFILCNGILENITKFIDIDNQNEGHKKMISELKRVINDEGCIIFGVNSKHSVKITWKNILNNLKELTKKRLTKYISVLENEELFVKPIWTFPSYNFPLYSGDICNIISLKSFFKNFNMLISISNRGKHQKRIMEFIFSIYKKMDYPFINIIFQIFSSSFAFCCWKKTDSKSLENWIKEETEYQNVLRLSRNEKILFALLNFEGEIEKVVYLKRYGDEIPDSIKFFERNSPEIRNISERIWKINWLKGRSVNSKNQNEVMLTVDELIKFQRETKLEIMIKDDIIEETSFIKKGLEHFGHNNIEYHECLKQYEEYIEQNHITMTSVHGDFWLTNIIYNPEIKNITIIDWDSYSKKGNPFDDFIWLLYHFMESPSKNHILKFRKYLEGGSEINEVSKMIEQIKNRINLHFGFQVDYILLLQINLMKWMILEEQLQEKNYSNDINSKKHQITIYEEILKLFF